MSIENDSSNPLEEVSIEKINESETFEELFKALREMGQIQGSQKIYSAEEIIGNIEMVRKGNMTLGTVTRSYHIRDAVRKLLIEENPSK